MAKPPICENCKYFKPLRNMPFPQCDHPLVPYVLPEYNREPFDPAYADSTEENHCGPEGKFWKAAFKSARVTE